MNIEQMTQKTREALQAAQRIAVEYSNNAVEQEHLLAALAQQQDGLITALPLGLRRIDALRTLTTEALAVLMPFKAQEIRHRHGIYYGQNAISKNLILADRKELLNGNGLSLIHI